MHTSLLGIFLDFQGLKFYQTNKDVKVGSFVAVETEHGTFLSKVEKVRPATDQEQGRKDFLTLFPPILRVATFQDLDFLKTSGLKEKNILAESQRQADSLKLEMKMLSAHLDCDENKVLITFTADGRVDFRELVRILSGLFRLRIELRQIGPRDQARSIGGIGACGLPLCCTTFLKTFDGISTSMAKNQLLAINIPKLSGACGKLMCCLKFEDACYTELRPTYPKMGEKIHYKKKDYTVTGINVLTDTITLNDGSSYENVNREQLERMRKGLEKSTEPIVFKDINSGVNLSGLGINDTNKRIAKIKESEERRMENLSRQSNSGKRDRRDNRNNNQRNDRNSRNNDRRRQNRPFSYSPNKESGFIPVSQIADKEVLSIKGHVKKEGDDKK